MLPGARTLCLVLALSAAAAAQVPAPAPGQASPATGEAPRDLTAVLEALRSKHDLPALAGAIVSRGRLEAVGACGVRERGSDVAVTVEDRFHLGSCTKAMTATLCALLVEKQALSWDSTAPEFLADAVGDPRPAWKQVTLAHLLSNRGGAPAHLEANGLWGELWASKEAPALQRLALARGVLTQEPLAPPGEKYVYSNAGFSLAGAMAERAAKCDFEELMRRELFAPLGMTSAGFGPPGDGKTLDQPRGHTAEGQPVPWGRAADNPAAIAPAGRVHCSIGDWAKFVALHLDGKGDRPRLLTAESLARLHTPAAGPGERYALGWLVTERPWAGGTVLTHSGSNTMWFAVAWLAPKKDFAVLVCCNQGGDRAQRACDDAAGALIGAHVPR